MRFRYSEWNQAMAQALQAFEDLLALFAWLLLQTNGDVDETLDLLKALQQRGLISAEADLEAFKERLQDEGLIIEVSGGFNLTDKGERKLRETILEQVFTNLKKGAAGQHQVPRHGVGKERLPETRPWRFGDAVTDLDSVGTIHNALKRGIDDITLAEDDLQVFETEHQTSCATVVMLDISHSMILYGEDRITPAKAVALALAELIQTRYPKDFLSVVTFGDAAEEIPVKDLPRVSVGPYHTNTKAGLELAQRILMRKKHANKQIFMITDGKPSAIFQGKQLYKNPIGLDPEIVNQTLREADACRRNEIPITTFMVARDAMLVDFVDRLTRINRGRAYYATLADLGEYILVDYMTNKTRRLR